METARAYHRMASEFGLTQDEIADQVGKDRSSVANFARLVHLPSEIQDLVESGAISAGHAKVIMGIGRPEDQLRLANRVAKERLSVRQTEKLAETELRPKPRQGATQGRAAGNPYTDLEARLQRRMGTKVTIQKRRHGGRVVIHYFSQPELERIIETLLD